MPRMLVTFTDSKSFIAEQFRSIRANINFSIPEGGLKTILVTSATPGEGKSTNAANIGIVFAQKGNKVLIIDADMRRPILHHTFNVTNTIGLSSVLARKYPFRFAIQESFMTGLDVIPSGPIPPNPAELLSLNSMEELIESVKDKYDIIIIDGPPLLSVSDSQLLSNICNGTLLIVKAGVSKKNDVLKAKSILDASQAKILGIVLNNYKIPKNNYYYEYLVK